MVVLVVASATIGLTNIVFEIAPLVILHGADLLAVFTQPQLDALALG